MGDSRLPINRNKSQHTRGEGVRSAACRDSDPGAGEQQNPAPPGPAHRHGPGCSRCVRHNMFRLVKKMLLLLPFSPLSGVIHPSVDLQFGPLFLISMYLFFVYYYFLFMFRVLKRRPVKSVTATVLIPSCAVIFPLPTRFRTDPAPLRCDWLLILSAWRKAGNPSA